MEPTFLTSILVNAVGGLLVIVFSVFTWQAKRLNKRMDDTYSKLETQQVMDLKMTGIKAELRSLQHTDERLEHQVDRLEKKIDKLIDKLS